MQQQAFSDDDDDDAGGVDEQDAGQSETKAKVKLDKKCVLVFVVSPIATVDTVVILVSLWHPNTHCVCAL